MSEWLDVLEGRARWSVTRGDCLEVLAQMPDQCVAHVITDPPYEAAAHTLGLRINSSGALVRAPLSFAPIDEATRSGSAAQWARVSTRWQIAFCQVEAINSWSDALSGSGLNVRRVGVWVKPDATPQFTGDRPGMGFESIVFSHSRGRSTWNGGGRVGVFVHNKNSGGAHDHEAQKPVPLMLELIELFTDPDEIILDPFCGSGTTGVACLRLGRRFVGIEKDEKYHQLSVDRLTAEGQGQSLRAFRAGQLPMFGGEE